MDPKRLVALLLTYLLPVQQHAVDLLNGLVGGVFSFEVNETVAFRIPGLVRGHFATENVAEGGEGVEHRLVVDRLVQILHEDVANARLTKAGVALGPHDSDRAPLHDVEVHRVQRSLRCSSLGTVSINIKELTWKLEHVLRNKPTINQANDQRP